MSCRQVVKAHKCGQEVSSSSPTCCFTDKVFHDHRLGVLHFNHKLQFCVNYLLLFIIFAPVFVCNMYAGIQHTAKTELRPARAVYIILSSHTKLYCVLHIVHSYNLHILGFAIWNTKLLQRTISCAW